MNGGTLAICAKIGVALGRTRSTIETRIGATTEAFLGAQPRPAKACRVVFMPQKV